MRTVQSQSMEVTICWVGVCHGLFGKKLSIRMHTVYHKMIVLIFDVEN